MRNVFLSVILSLVFLFNSALTADDDVHTPNKVFAVRGTETGIPCMSKAPLSKMKFGTSSQPSSTGSRLYTVEEEGDPNLLMVVIQNAQLSDNGKFLCDAGGSSSEVELVVFEPSYPTGAARVMPSNDVLLEWKTPVGSGDAVKAYHIYVTEVADSVGKASFEVQADSSKEEQSFLLEDLKPGATYDFELSAIYFVGPDDDGQTIAGPKSPKGRIQTPQFTSPPVLVKAIPWRNSSILVTWRPPTNLDPKAIDGYRVVYKAVPVKKNSISGEVNVTSSDANNQWKAVLSGLKSRNRYEIAVYAIQNGVSGKKSQSIVFRHDGFGPEMSINAIPVGPETVLITLRTIGGSDVKKLRVLYSDDTATQWKRVAGCKIGQHCIVRGLQPRSRYYFSARARVNRRARAVVTHALTPPSALDIPVNLVVTARTDHSINTHWDYSGRSQPIGYILLIEVKEEGQENFRPFKQQAVFGTMSAKSDGLRSQEQYRARVVPFDTQGMGTSSETVLFSIARTGIEPTPGAESPTSHPPKFIEIPEAMIQVDEGENVTLSCTAIGVPHPVVQWTINGSVVSQPQDRRNVFTWHAIQDSMTVKCEAENSLAIISYDVHVDVSHGLEDIKVTPSAPPRDSQMPTLAEQLPSTVTRKRGEPIHFRCRFNGNPPPIVTWYQMDRPIGQPAQTESLLAIPSVQKSTTLRCEGKNKNGVEYHMIEVIVEDKDPVVPTSRFIVSMRYIALSSNLYVVKWTIDEGDLNTIRFFDVAVATDTGIVLMRQRLSYDQRSVRLQDLTPGASYVVTLKTGTTNGVLDESTISFVPSAKAPKIDEPKLLLEVVEIRHNQARVDFTSLTAVRGFRLRVKDLAVRRLGNTILDRNLDGSASSINLQRLKPNRNYQVILDATTSNRRDTISASVIFKTSIRGGSSISVASRSDETTTTAAPTTVATTPTTPPTTTEAVDKTYQLKVRTTSKTPYQVDVRWTVDKGNLDAINNFLVTIKGKAGFTLLQQQVLGDQRSITIQSLTPNTKYVVDLKAKNSANALLAESSIVLFTPSADAVVDTSNPFLDFEANEIRSSSARLEWGVVNGDPRQISGYTLKVLDRDASGPNLLTQNMAASSLSIKLRQLPPSRQFYVIIEALNRSRRVVMSSSLTFSTAAPGRYGTSVNAASRSPSNKSQRIRATTTPAPRRTPKPSREAFLKMEIRPALPGGAVLNWTLITGRDRPVINYQIKVRLDSAQGRLMMRKSIPARSSSFSLSGLERDRTYHIELVAIDRYRRTLAKASSFYLLPPPGHNVEPIRASSKSLPRKSANTKSDLKVIITAIKAVNPTSITLRWRVDPQVSNLDPPIVRYTKDGGSFDRAQSKYAPRGATQMTIGGLEPKTTYLFQIKQGVANSRLIRFSQWVVTTTPQA